MDPSQHTIESKLASDVIKTLLVFSKKTNLIGPVMSVSDSLWKSVGIKNQTRITQKFATDYEKGVVALIDAIINHDNLIATLLDTAGGCFMRATLPVDVLSLGGTLAFQVIEASENEIEVIAASEVRGQLFDFGKGKRAIEQIFSRTSENLEILG